MLPARLCTALRLADLLQTLCHHRKRRFQPLIHRRIQLFIHGLPHLFQLMLVLRADFFQTAFNRLAHALHALLVAAQLFFQCLIHAADSLFIGVQPPIHRLAHMLHAFLFLPAGRAELTAQRVHLPLLRAGHFPHHTHHGIVDALHGFAQFLPRLSTVLPSGLIRLRELFLNGGSHLLHLFFGRG